MLLEALLSFFMIWQLRKTLRILSLHPEWEQLLSKGLIAVVILFLVGEIGKLEIITKWIWHLLLLFLISIPFRYEIFQNIRIITIAVLPLVVINFFKEILTLSDNNFFAVLEDYTNYAFPVAVTWMIALLIKFKKQQKTLEKERKQRLEEEEQNRLIAARKAELEVLVAERTAELTQQKEELHQALDNLKATQTQLIHREKMASLGELTAGVAHEIQNPLNFVNNFSELSVELAAELHKEIIQFSITQENKENVSNLLQDLMQNQQKIAYHGRRADAIVKGMLLHSRKSTGEKELTDLNALADEYLRLSYHGIRAKDKSFNATIQTDFDPNIGTIQVVPQDLGRVLINLFNNAFYAVNQKQKQLQNGFMPIVSVCTKKAHGKVEVIVHDNGNGIPKDALDKLFQPFFTTKPAGEGTGLGLSLSYEIITKGHGGEMKVKTEEGSFAEFIVQLPVVVP